MFSVPTQEPVVHHQLQQISVDTNKTVGVSRVLSGLRVSRAETSDTQRQKDQAGSSRNYKSIHPQQHGNSLDSSGS